MEKQLGINKKFLLSLYSVGLVLFLIVIADYLFLEKSVKSALIKDSSLLIFLSTILVLPHIMASNITLIDPEYIKHYKIPLLKALSVGLFVSIISPMLFGITITFLVIALFTMQHVITQQFGILKSLFSFKTDKDFDKWQKYSIIAAILIYIEIYHEGYLPQRFMLPVNLGLNLFMFLSAFYSYKLLKKALKSKISKLSLWYFIANAALILLAYFFVISGYPLFAFLLPRIVHDLSAFTFYISHDTNRNKVKNPPNPLYKIASLAKIPIPITCIALSFFMSYLICSPDNIVTAGRLMTLCTFFHYYIEGTIWKRNAPHRKYVGFR